MSKMEPLALRDHSYSLAAVKSQTTAPARKRKLRLIAMKTFEDEEDCLPITRTGPALLAFPNLDFGRPTMDKAALERALHDQLRLHSEYGAHATDELTGDDAVFLGYQNIRLAVVGFFVSAIPFGLAHMEQHHSVFMPTVNLLDRYVVTCMDRGEDPRQLLMNMSNIRAACLSLSLKMHITSTNFSLEELEGHEEWVHGALITDSSTPRFSVCTLSSVRGIEEAEKRIIAELRGALFPSNAENTISLLCSYLILEHLGSQMTSPVASDCVQNERVAAKALGLFTITALDAKLLRVKRWKSIAVCCLLGTIEVCVRNPAEGLHLEESLISLLEKLKPGEFTRNDLYDLVSLFTQGCVVCTGTFACPNLLDSLLKISSMTCPECRKKQARNSEGGG